MRHQGFIPRQVARSGRHEIARAQGFSTLIGVRGARSLSLLLPTRRAALSPVSGFRERPDGGRYLSFFVPSLS